MVKSTLKLMTFADAEKAYSLTKHFPFIREGLWLVSEGDMLYEGILEFDAYDSTVWTDTTEAAEWRKEFGLTGEPTGEEVAGIVVNGNLNISGSLLNGDDGDVAFLLVLGNLNATGVMTGGSITVVTGDINASECVYSAYNDGFLSVGGNMNTPIYINEEHNTKVKGKINAKAKSTGGRLTKDIKALLSNKIRELGDMVQMLCEGESVLLPAGEAPKAPEYEDLLPIVLRSPEANFSKMPKELRTEQFYYDLAKSLYPDYFSIKMLTKIPPEMYSGRVTEAVRTLCAKEHRTLYADYVALMPIRFRTERDLKIIFKEYKSRNDDYIEVMKLVPISMILAILEDVEEKNIEAKDLCDYYVDLARAFIYAKDYDKALELLRIAKEKSIAFEREQKQKDPQILALGDFRPHYYEGYVYFLQGNAKAAAACLKTAKSLSAFNRRKPYIWLLVYKDEPAYGYKGEIIAYEKRENMIG